MRRKLQAPRSNRSLILATIAICVSLTSLIRPTDLFTLLLYTVKLLQTFGTVSRVDLFALVRSQNELSQMLSGQTEFVQSLYSQVLPKGEFASLDLQPRSLPFGMRMKYVLLVAATDVSVIVPTWNEEKYLERCLASLMDQSLNDRFEIIVVDGGSNDRTLEIAHQNAHRVLVKPGAPVGATRNIGASVAKGEILAFIDADTIASKRWIEEIVQSINAYGKAVGVTGPTLPYEGSRLDELMYHVATGWAQRVSLRLGFPHVAGFNCAYRKNAFWNAGGFDENRELSEDVMLSLRIRHQGQILFDENMIAYTSLRRIKECGYAYLTTYYAINAALMILFQRTLSYPKIR